MSTSELADYPAASAAPGDAGQVAAAFLGALLSGDRRAAFEAVDGAVRSGLTLRALYLEVFQPAMERIGQLWAENVITVADEHLATAITEASMARLYERLFRDVPPGRRTLLAACADEERHALGMRMVCDVLEMDGWDTSFLGASVPTPDLVQMVRTRRPDVIALSASTPQAVPRAQAVITALRTALGDATPLVLVGGRPFRSRPELAREIGADHTAMDAEAARRLLKEVLP